MEENPVYEQYTKENLQKRRCFFYLYVCSIMSLLDYYIRYASIIAAGHLMMEHVGFGMLDIPSLIHAYTYQNRLKQLLVSCNVCLLSADYVSQTLQECLRTHVGSSKFMLLLEDPARYC